MRSPERTAWPNPFGSPASPPQRTPELLNRPAVEFLTELSVHPAFYDVIATLVVLLLIALLRSMFVRSVESSDLPAERRRRLLVQTRNGALLLFVGAAAIIWAQQLQTAALSLAAMAVALVIATKELLLCFTGALLRISAQGFSLGDRIEVAGNRGDVIDIGALTTTILEVGPGPSIHQATGRTVVLPNSLFLTHPVINESFTDPYVLHTATVPLTAEDDIAAAERRLLAAAEHECRRYLTPAAENMARVGRKHGLEAPSVTPSVWLALPSADRRELVLRFPTPVRKRGRVAQAILRRYLASTTADATHPERAQAERGAPPAEASRPAD